MRPNLLNFSWKALAVYLLGIALPAGSDAQTNSSSGRQDSARYAVSVNAGSITVPAADIQPGLRIGNIEHNTIRADFGDPRDYRWEGAIAGAVVLGLVAGAVANGMC